MKFMTIVMWWVTCMKEEEEDCRLKCNQSSSTTALWPSSSIDWQYVGKATTRPNYTLNSFSFRSREVNLVSNQTIIDVHFSFPQTYINGNKSKTLAASFRCVFFSGQTSLKVDVGQKDFVYLLSSYLSPMFLLAYSLGLISISWYHWRIKLILLVRGRSLIMAKTYPLPIFM